MFRTIGNLSHNIATVDTGEPADLFVIAGTLCFHLPIKVVLCPKQAHLVSAIAHDGGGGPCPQPQYPVLFGHCHCTMNGTLQKGRLSEHDCMASCKCASNSQNQSAHSSPHTIHPIYNLPICLQFVHQHSAKVLGWRMIAKAVPKTFVWDFVSKVHHWHELTSIHKHSTGS